MHNLTFQNPTGWEKKKTSKKIKIRNYERHHTQRKRKRNTKTEKRRWKKTIAVCNALRTPKHVKCVKSNQRQRTSPNQPNVFFLGGQLE